MQFSILILVILWNNNGCHLIGNFTKNQQSMTEEKVIEALSNVVDPDSKKDIIALNWVSNIQIDGHHLKFDL